MNNKQQTMNLIRKTTFFSNGVNYELRKRGFSLTEVLMAVGILAIGMLFIGGTFLVGIHFSTIATEQTIAAVAADEAFAKIKIYGINFNSPRWPPNPTIACVDFNDVSGIWPMPINPNEFAYPSTNTVAEKQYYWSALCRKVEGNLVQVTVFVSRKAGVSTKYWARNPLNWPQLVTSERPVAVDLSVSRGANLFELVVNDLNPSDGVDEATFVNDGYTLIDGTTGQIYRVLERYSDRPNIIQLDRSWAGGLEGLMVWVIPPPFGGGRGPCIAVYPTEMRF